MSSLTSSRPALLSLIASLMASSCAPASTSSTGRRVQTATVAPTRPAPDSNPLPAPHRAATGLFLQLVPETVEPGGRVVVRISNAGPSNATLHDPGGSNGCAVSGAHAASLVSDSVSATTYATPRNALCTMVFIQPSDIELAPAQSVEWTRIDTSRVFTSDDAQSPLAPGRYQVTAGPGLTASLEVR